MIIIIFTIFSWNMALLISHISPLEKIGTENHFSTIWERANDSDRR